MFIYNPNTKIFDPIGDPVFDNSVFTLNKNEDMVVHKTSEATTTYYLSNRIINDQVFTYDAISDRGHDFTILFDLDNGAVKLMGNQDDAYYLILYSIKAVF